MENCFPYLLWLLQMVCHAFRTYECARRFSTFYEWHLRRPARCMHAGIPRWHPHLFQLWKEHIWHVCEVLSYLQQHNLYARTNKCFFHVQTVEYLGYILSLSGLTMAADKVQVIQDWPEPWKIKDIQSFLGSTNFYRCFIPHYSDITILLRTDPQRNPIQNWDVVRALAWLDLFPFLSPFSLYGLSYCMPKLTSLISYCALS